MTKEKQKMQWYRMDLHLHTPASKDYQQPEITYLDILQQVERRGIDIIAFTDHNTIRGFREMYEEIEKLEWLAGSGRVNPEEEYRLSEYQRLLRKILVLPGFEFTATFGFHILGIFPNDLKIRYIEHILLDLNVPAEMIDDGETNVGATADVLAAYEAIYDGGGITIAAHVNSSHGVAMRGMNFGGQTRIAYTQDPSLFALEVTDLDRKGRRTTQRFFDGSKPEYPRPMRCIQGSDAHRLDRDPNNNKHLGVGERVTEVLLPELSFNALYDLFAGKDLARTRPFRGGTDAPYDHVQAARQEGPSIIRSFHESMTKRGGKLYAICSDICAFTNTNGGTVYVGVSDDKRRKPSGLKDINSAVPTLEKEIERRITPPIDVNVDVLQTEGVPIVRIQVDKGTNPPYAIDDSKIYVRDDTETSLAVRDEIVQLVLGNNQLAVDATASPVAEANGHSEKKKNGNKNQQPERNPATASNGSGLATPRTGVEVIATERRNDVQYHHVRDLRNGNIVQNVTRQSARKLWHYAIIQQEEKKNNLNQLDWHGEIALVSQYDRAGRTRYDVAWKKEGRTRVFYGVTEDGIQDTSHKPWRELLELEDED